MEELKLKGALIKQRTNCSERKLLFKTIANMIENKELILPLYQTDLDNDKVSEMIESYKKNPDYLLFKNKVVIGVIIKNDNIKLYIVDGQHRISMAHHIYMNDNQNTDILIFCYYLLKSEDDMKSLFNEINKDSLKIQHYVSLPELIKNKYEIFKKYCHDNWSKYFSDSKSKTNKRYCISEFIDILSSKKYFERNINFIHDIKNKNDVFYNLVDYKTYYDENSDYFYKDEHKTIEKGFIMSLKNNNFIDYIINNEIPNHSFKSSKITISPQQRLSVWKKYFDYDTTNICMIYNCTNEINYKKNGFEFGLIKAKHKEFNLDNIKPICSDCKKNMDNKNWIVYETELKMIQENEVEVI
jgi:hypothetical protein